MPEPTDNKAFADLVMRNQRASGWGIDTKQHMPCPGCAAPDWQVYRIIDAEQAMQVDTRCPQCERSFKTIIERTPAGLSLEFVQTGGPDLPDWYEPKMRRVDR